MSMEKTACHATRGFFRDGEIFTLTIGYFLRTAFISYLMSKVNISIYRSLQAIAGREMD